MSCKNTLPADMSTAKPEMIATDLASGAPQNPDGTINLIEYAAWLAKEEDNVDQSE